MATNKKITELTEVELGGIADDDVLVIVDISENETKKVRRSTLRTDLAGVSTLTATSPLAVDAAIGDVTVSISGQVPVNNGGTGASTAAAARTNLGLGTISTQDYTAVNIDGGAIDGTPIGATTQSTGGFSSLTIASSTAVTSVDTDLTSVSASDDTLASAKAIKTYVDAQVGTVDTLSEILANGNTTGANNIIVTAGQSITVDTISETTAANGVAIDGVTLKDGGATVTADVNFGDNDKAIFGAGSDLQIYHDGSHSYIQDAGTGEFRIKTNGNIIQFLDGSNNYLIRASVAADVGLYYNTAQKLATTSTGIDVTGTITFDGGTTSADLNFGDNDKAIFGAGSDLQIYHDAGGNSFINESGTGSLVVKATNTFINATDDAAMAAFYDEGQVELYHNASKKFETTSTGIDVTGDVGGDTATITGSITSNPASGANILFQNGSGAAVGRVTFDSTNLKVRGDSSKGLKLGSNGSDVVTIDTSGNVGIGTSSPVANTPLTLQGASGYTDTLWLKSAGTNIDSRINIAPTGTGNAIINNSNGTGIDFQISGVDKVSIDSSGNTTFAGDINFSATTTNVSPTTSDGSDNARVFFNGGGAASPSRGSFVGVYGNENSDTGRLLLSAGNVSGGDIEFHTGNSVERMRIDSSGNVAIGSTAPDNKLFVAATATGGYVANTDTTWNGITIRQTLSHGSSAAGLKFETTSTTQNGVAAIVAERVTTDKANLNFLVSDDNGTTYTEALILDGSGIAIFNGPIRNADGSTSAPSYTFSNDTDTGISRPSDNTLAFSTTSDERMRIDSSGNVGIGTASPAAKVHVFDTNPEVRLQSSGTSTTTEFGMLSRDGSNVAHKTSIKGVDSSLTLNTGGNAGNSYVPITALTIDSSQNATFAGNIVADAATPQIIWKVSGTEKGYARVSSNTLQINATNDMALRIGGADALVIDSSQNVGIGTTNTAGTVGSFDGIILYNAGVIGVAATSNRSIFSRRSTDGDVIEFRKDSTAVGSISVTGSATAYNTSSDYRLKENVTAIVNATERLKQLNPVRFNFIADADNTVDGFLAHEVSDYVPEAVTGEKDAVDADGNPEYQGIDQSKLVPLLVATIKELEARITALES